MNLNLKIIAIFFILIFCMTPLSSADLNQTDIKTSDSTNEIIEIDDKISTENATANISPNEAKSLKATENIRGDDAKSPERSENVKEVETNATRENQTRESSGSFNVQINDFYEGDHPIITVSTPNTEDFLNLYGSVDCHIYNEKYSSPIYKEYLSNEMPAAFRISDTLEPGTYKVSVSGFNGTSNYQGYTTFTVKENPNRIKPNLNLKISSVYEGNEVIAKVKSRGNFTDYVDFYLNGTYFTDILVKNGYGETSFHDLRPSKFYGAVKFKGNVNFLPDEADAYFTVYPKAEIQLKAHVDDMSTTESAKLKITSNCTQKIKIKYIVSDPRYWLFTQGEAEIGSNDVIELPKTSYEWKYTVRVSFEGNADYNPCETSTSFNVTEYRVDPELSINVNNITYGEEAKIEINANETLTGTVQAKLDTLNKLYNVDIVDGHGPLKIKNLTKGDYSITASFTGNDDFKPSQTTAKFNVKGLESKINVHANDINQGQTPTLTIKTDSSMPRKVTVQIYKNSTIITGHEEEVSGYKTIKMHEHLEPGEYVVKVIYKGDEISEPSENSTSFKVNGEIE